MWFLVSLFLFASLQPAWAQSQAAEAAFAAGQYDAAYADVAADRAPDACAFGARALLAKAMSGDGQPPGALLTAALNEADTALAVQPRHIEGRLQKAIALSLMVRPMNLKEARDSGYGTQARDLAEAVLADDPENAYAHGFLAVWHIEVVHRGGFLGAMVLGASVADAEDHYAAAVKASPGDAALHWQYARALAALNARKYRKQIAAALEAACAAPVDTQLEQVMQGRARTLLSAVDSASSRDVEALAQTML
ncbi:hypothetical protein [Hyphomonas johnsonii]|uniref:hypothetical protein n=1 Tax=Hyphomonas johnsonii TaxID=81031 RepID=UPI000B2D0CD0|nr:hypothetical protein [Hyphomonas johnsonii]